MKPPKQQNPSGDQDPMLAGIKAQVTYLKTAPQSVYRQISATLGEFPIPAHIYLTGCGDSWYCGMATSLAFNRWTGISTQAPQALEFSRYLVQGAPSNSLLIAVSNSGRVSRTLEAVEQAWKAGIRTLALTGNMQAGISQVADESVDLAYSERRFAPGTSSYIASLVTQYLLALFLAGRTGRISDGEIARRITAIEELSNAMAVTMESNWETLKALGKTASQTQRFVFVGAGPNTGSAYFSMAKLIETSGVQAVAQEMEEWAHIQYFNSSQDTYTFLFALPGASLDRAREILPAIRHTGSKLIVLCAPEEPIAQEPADQVVTIFGSEDELLSPLVSCVPAELLAYFFASSKNLTMFGFDHSKTKEINFRTIYESHRLET